ncbi:energy transducer TonB [Candidatus Manganitrophus noduliformans]|uniref:Energy transducer TonB n=1 Tax=Candidatus Manganitrophus noduliformans TaxID=2606439 RepID=A0A7X6DR06_9BACT|nr:energy transducer TonB [Candidatus Manganitrophus noduliformans]NKE71729.1 energy transducer TonB [Candidatus Manganitrophus noduliformans]
MILLKQIFSGTSIGIFLSTLVHAGLGGGVYYTLTSAVEPSPRVVAELDLSMTSLLPAPPAPPPPPGPGAQAKTTPAPVRTVAKKRAAASSLPQKETPPKPEAIIPPVVSEVSSDLPEVPEAPETPSTEEAPSGVSSVEAQETDAGESAAEEPVSVAAAESGEPGGVTGGIPGGTPGGEMGGVSGGSAGAAGRYLSAAQVAKLPQWVDNLITPRDYPRSARRRGKDGRVLLSVFIDAAGRVRDVRLLQGSDEALNEVALRKVREAVFTPAYNREGEPVACKVTLPIRFHLQ